jgi:predicted nucleic acid-binding protein
MSNKAIVLDANILIRAVLGKRVRELIVDNAESVQFFAPDVAYADARKYLPALLEKRGVTRGPAMAVLDALESIVRPLELGVYAGLQAQALQRIATRDADDWPVLACAMAIGCPVWTEDADFFGTGIATWTSDRVELYLLGIMSKTQPKNRS